MTQPPLPPRTPPVLLGEVYQNVTASIEYAEVAMSKARTSVEKARASKESRQKVVSKASEIVNALLEPASQVANLLDGIGALFPPCKIASNTLAALVKLEVDRRDNDVRIALLFLDFATALANLGSLTPGFQSTTTLTRPLEGLLQRFTDLMKEFGQFCEAYYEAKALKTKLRHLLYSKTNKDSLQNFTNRLVSLKNDLIALLSQQAVLMLGTQADILKRIESRLAESREFYAAVSDENEDRATAFVTSHGGPEVVQMNDRLLEQLAATVGESLTPSILRAVKEGAEVVFRQSQASFLLKFQFALEQRIDESQEMILNELKSGPYELIHNPDVKEIWKNTAAKESSVKRRQFIDGMNYHFNIQFKKYKAEHHRAEREDSWTKNIISKVHYHPAIGDAIDDDASGYISIEELNEFMRRKPEKWTVPQWIAYWAYGWDADNQLYRDRINRTYTQLEKLRDGQGPQAGLVASYLQETKDRVTVFANSTYNMRELDSSADMKMERLREELRTRNENELKTRLKSVNHKIDYSVLAAITGTERIEETFCPLASLLISRDLWLMSKPNVTQEAVEEATSSITALLDAMRGRIGDLKIIWRRQRMDVDTQVRYYANGLLEDYYRKYRKEEFDTDLENLGEESEWGSEDEWSDDGAEDDHRDRGVADSDNNNPTKDLLTAFSDLVSGNFKKMNSSGAAELDQPANSRSIPAGGYNSAHRGTPPALPARARPARISNNQQRPPPPLPARARPVRVSNNQQGRYDQVRHQSYPQHQSYPDSTTYRGAEGYEGYGDATHYYDGDQEREVVGQFQIEEDRGEGGEEEAEEQEPEPEYEQEGGYPNGEPVEYEEEVQGYNAHNGYEGYRAGQTVEEGEEEEEDDDGDGDDDGDDDDGY